MPRREVHWTLTGRGFKLDLSETIVTRYKGILRPHGRSIPVVIEINDWGFATPPKIRLDEEFDELPLGASHIEDSRGICYSGGTRRLFDRYNPGGTILTCLEAAKKALENIITGQAVNDIPGEFASYWGLVDGSNPVYFDFDDNFKGMCRFLDVPSCDSSEFAIATARNETVLFFESLIKKRDQKRILIERQVAVINSKAVAITGSDWPPSTLTAVLSWLKTLDKDTAKEVRKKIGPSGQCKIPGRREQHLVCNPVILIRFRNGLFGFEILVPASTRKAYHPGRPSSIYSKLILTGADSTKIRRLSGRLMTLEFMAQRNIEGGATLSNRNIALVGCGTIGSHLSRFLVQAGAGSGKRGEFLLIDPERLEPGNFGRHLLGYPGLGCFKAEGCAKVLKMDFPGTTILHQNRSALDIFDRLKRFDIVIDATGVT